MNVLGFLILINELLEVHKYDYQMTPAELEKFKVKTNKSYSDIYQFFKNIIPIFHDMDYHERDDTFYIYQNGIRIRLT